MPALRIPIWHDWPKAKKQKFRHALIAAVAAAPDKRVSHEMIEGAVFDVDADIAQRTMEDDEVHEMITGIYAKYCHIGAVD